MKSRAILATNSAQTVSKQENKASFVAKALIRFFKTSDFETLAGVLRNQSIKAIAFDMDGTLIDTETANWEIVLEGLRAEGIELKEIDKQAYMGTTIQDFCEKQLLQRYIPDEAKAKAQTISNSKITKFSELLKENKIETFPRVIKLLRKLAEKEDSKIALVTNSKQEAMEMLRDHFKLTNLFKISYGREDTDGKPKPNPYIYGKVIREFGINPDQLLVFEDSGTGIEAAVKAGATVMAIKNTDDQNPTIPTVDNVAKLDLTSLKN